MKRHMYGIGQPLCEVASSAEAIGNATRAIYRVIECPDCLQRAIDESDERTRVLRELLAKMESAAVRCRVYNTPCINPSYCSTQDACCAGDAACTPSEKVS